MSKVKQISYSCWGNGPKQYWRDVENIGSFIAAKLTHTHSDGYRVSTINVSTYKEKYGEVRVYTTLACPQLIKEKFKLASVDNIPKPIYKLCMLEDAKYYREVYLEMISLVPHYESIIKGGADYYELLLPTKELKNFLELKKENNNHYLYDSFNLETFEELDTFLHKVYKIFK